MNDDRLRIDSPIRNAFDRYINSDVGRAAVSTMDSPEQIRDRLWSAFLAGIDHVLAIVNEPDYATVKGETGLTEDQLNQEPPGYDEERREQ